MRSLERSVIKREFLCDLLCDSLCDLLFEEPEKLDFKLDVKASIDLFLSKVKRKLPLDKKLPVINCRVKTKTVAITNPTLLETISNSCRFK